MVEHDRGRILEVRRGKNGDPDALDGVLLPGLLNAHVRLERSAIGPVSGGRLLSWRDGLAQALHGVSDEAREAAGRKAAQRLFESGHAAICDVSTRGDTASWLVDAGLSGVVQQEFADLDRRSVPQALGQVIELGGEVGSEVARVVVRPAAHGPASTAPALIAMCCRAPGHSVPACVQVGEARGEIEFLASGTGPYARLLDEVQADWRWWEPPGVSPIVYLEMLGVLNGKTLLVHCVHATPSDREVLRQTQTPVCLCPRSNAQIEGALPNVPALVEAGLRLTLGSSSHASAADLDVLSEVRFLRKSFPDIPAAYWIQAVTSGASDALGLAGFGRLLPGTAPGLLFFEGAGDLDDALSTSRRWLHPPRALIASL
ncbi:MAG: amidohydrolase family protein [Proteobacteria bacterium]|nr:amidohydrolase family protein [Pseudomonadota bacterium]